MDPGRAHPGHSLIPLARAGIALALAFVAHGSARAQAADDYWRWLQSESDPTVLLAADAPTAIPDALAEGLLLFRAYELTGDEGSARRARELLRRARVAAEYRAWHALALAMVYARGPDSRIRLNDHGDYVTDPNSLGSARALRLLRSALQVRPGFREAALELARWAIDREHAVVAAEAELALANLPDDAEVLQTRAALNLLLNQPHRSAELAARAQMAGIDVSVARHTRAWALFQYAASAAEAVELYYRGAEVMTDEGRREYARYLEPILTLEESNEWHATPNERAAEWLRRYWSENAARAGVLPEERLVEHYRRVQRARIEFPNTAPLAVLQQQARFAIGEDSRRYGLSLHGLMLVRHGNPYRLAQVEQCLSNPWPAEGGSGTICGQLGGSRLALFQSMTRLARGDSYSPFVRPLTLYYGVYAFRGAGDTNDIVFAAGLPVRSANALIEGTDRIAGTLSTVILRDSGDYVRRDSAFSNPVPRYTDPLAGETDAVTLLFGVLPIPAEEAEHQFRFTVSDTRRTAGATAAGTVRTYDFGTFSISDIVVAPETMPTGWRRGDVTIAFAPLATYLPGETIALYYEIYGMEENAAYRTEIELAPPADNLGERILDVVRDRSVRFRFEGVAGPSHPVYGQQEERTITLEGVEPGVWTLRVRVTDVASGRNAVRETAIEIAEPREPTSR